MGRPRRAPICGACGWLGSISPGTRCSRASRAPAEGKLDFSNQSVTIGRAMKKTTTAKVGSSGTREKPWLLKTPPGISAFEAFRDESLVPPALVVRVGKTELRYHLRSIEDLHQMLVRHGDWMSLGGADEQKPAAEGTVEAWARSPKNPVGGWYGLDRKSTRL